MLDRFGRLDILVNNAARDPKVKAGAGRKTGRTEWSRFEQFPLDAWQADLDVGLTGAFLCAQVLGREMAKRRRGVILNISSDLGLIGPDQRIYRKRGLPADRQPTKPVSYAVVKSALIGLTRYLATYLGRQRGPRECPLPGWRPRGTAGRVRAKAHAVDSPRPHGPRRRVRRRGAVPRVGCFVLHDRIDRRCRRRAHGLVSPDA